jgi:hypothetical protein
VRVGNRAGSFKADEESFRALVDAAQVRVKAADEKKVLDEAALIYEIEVIAIRR